MGPVLLEINTILHNTLLLGGVKATSVNDTKLKPRSCWVTMGPSFLSVTVEQIIQSSSLRVESEVVFSEGGEKVLICLGCFSLEIPLVDSILPLLNLV